MKVLHGMTEVAGQGSYSVKGLKFNGIDAEMAVWRKNKFGYPFDYFINVGYTKVLYPYYAIKMFIFALYAAFKFDCFHFHFGWTLLPGGFDLRWLKFLGKKIYIEFHGSDIRWVFNRTKYEGLPLPEENKRQKKLILRILKYADGIIIHDEELRKHIPITDVPIYIVPLRVDISRFKAEYPKHGVKKPVVVHAPSKRGNKGSDYVFKAVEEFKDQIEFVLVENKTQEEAFEIYRTADIIIDQLLAGTYGVFSIEAMALGKPVITYIDDEIIKTFPDELPIISASTKSLKQELKRLIENEELRIEKGMESRKYVEKYHDCNKNAQLLKEIYQGASCEKSAKEVFKYISHFN